MSEYQYVAFEAVDRSLTDAELAFAHKQSSRAEITRRSFRNEYHFGEFRGDAGKLLQRGYDIYLHYANFGIRTVAMRLPSGLPFPKHVWAEYLTAEGLVWRPDRRGPGGVLWLEPDCEPDELEELWEPAACMPAMVELRNRLAEGQLAALYLMWIAAVAGEVQVAPAEPEPPVPTGLDQLVAAVQPFVDFFGLSPHLLATAAKRADAKRARERRQRMEQMVDEPTEWLRRVDKLVDARGTANYEQAAEILSEIREALGSDGGEELTRAHAAKLTRKHPTLNRMKSALRRRGLLG